MALTRPTTIGQRSTFHCSDKINPPEDSGRLPLRTSVLRLYVLEHRCARGTARMRYENCTSSVEVGRRTLLMEQSELE